MVADTPEMKAARSYLGKWASPDMVAKLAEIIRREAVIPAVEAEKELRELAESRERNCNALIAKIQKVVSDFYGPGQRHSDFDVLDSGVAGIVQAVEAERKKADDAVQLLRDGILAMTGRARVQWADRVRKALAEWEAGR